eukprot:TRINITY_DN1226_c2_g1_i2.p1 TRINITY_DN1226_c2_g1~~TRINITY_DN1226_c2_g1_i2.p1  ORF type:complete len:238 (+),score=111.33 TRINITY_DN1226_c2_g1_i2:87-716(+)
MALAVAATPVTVEVFTESYCPCSGTFHEQYYNNIMPLIDSIAVLNRSWDGAAHGDTVKCFHGERECEANTLQACAQNMAGANYKQWLNYTVCINGPCKNVGCPEQYSVAENSSLAREQSCAAAVGLDWNTMYSCYTGPLGKQLLMRDALFDSAEKEGYGLRGLPVVKVNGKLFSKFWDCDSYKADYHKALVQEVCAAYTGTDKPAACSQ